MGRCKRFEASVHFCFIIVAGARTCNPRHFVGVDSAGPAHPGACGHEAPRGRLAASGRRPSIVMGL